MPRPLGTNALGTLEALPLGLPPWETALEDPRSQIFYAVELQIYRPGSTSISYTLGLGTHALGTLTLASDPAETYTTLHASDLGYVSRIGDVVGQLAYAPYLAPWKDMLPVADNLAIALRVAGAAATPQHVAQNRCRHQSSRCRPAAVPAVDGTGPVRSRCASR